MRRLSIALLSLLTIIPSLHAAPPNTATVDVAPLLRAKGINTASTGIYAVWADSGQPVAAYHPDQLLNPASTAKIITSYCTLKTLGPDFTFTTKYFSESAVEQSKIHNLWIQGQGDASLVIEELWLHVEQLKNLGLQQITGDLILDGSFFDATDYPGRQENNERAYNAKPSGLSLNYNSIATTDSAHPNQTTYSAAGDPILSFGNTFKQLLQDAGIAFHGQIKTGLTPSGLHPIISPISRPLSWVIYGMNKFSNNFIAESLLKYLGTLDAGAPGSTAKGLKKIEGCLSQLAIKKEDFVLENGSGLSYNNQVTPRQLVRVLQAGFSDFSVGPEFISSLSTYGVDGTMRKRNAYDDLAGQVRAKTGSLNAISTLVGFLPTANHRVIAFAILMNGLKADLWEAHKVQDKILETLAQQK